MMKKIALLILIAVMRIECLLIAGEKDPQKGVTIEMNTMSRYLWRGFDLNGRYPAFQLSPSLMVTPDLSVQIGITAGLDQAIQIDEVDASVTYERNFFDHEMTISIGLSTYQYLATESSKYLTGSNEYANGQEISLGVRKDFHLISASLEYARGLGGKDGGDNKGNYAIVSLEKSVLIQDSKYKGTLSF